MAIDEQRKHMELMWHDRKVAGTSEERPWERVGKARHYII